MNVYITIIDDTIATWGVLMGKLAERYTDATVTIADNSSITLTMPKQTWGMADKQFVEQLITDNLIAHWSVTNIPNY